MHLPHFSRLLPGSAGHPHAMHSLTPLTGASVPEPVHVRAPWARGEEEEKEACC